MLSLVGADVKAWYEAMPKVLRMPPQKRPATSLGLPSASSRPRGVSGSHMSKNSVLEDFFSSKHCCVCDEPHASTLSRTNRTSPLCPKCLAKPSSSYALMQQRAAMIERQHRHMVRICLHCGGGGGGVIEEGAVVCNSIDCEVFFERAKLSHEARVSRALIDEVSTLLP
jgi:DNA polymerase zeta